MTKYQNIKYLKTKTSRGLVQNRWFTLTPMNMGVSSQRERGFTPSEVVSTPLPNISSVNQRNVHHNWAKKPRQLHTGFTLVELIVSLALFIVVVFIVTSSFLTTVNASKHARSARAGIDALSIAMENMARNIRTGSDYYCATTNEFQNTSQTEAQMLDMIAGGKDCFAGARTQNLLLKDASGHLRGYAFRDERNECSTLVVNGQYQDPTDCQIQFRGYGTGFSYLTSNKDIQITNLSFYVSGTNAANDLQPRVGIAIKGTAGSDPKTQIPFTLYTSVTQRMPK